MLERVKQLLQNITDRQAFFDLIGLYYPLGSEGYLLIEKAYDVSKDAFRKINRDGGQRYFEHLRAVALIVLVHMRQRDPDIIAAALLHDIIEDIEGWTQERVALQFNRAVSKTVWWVSKPPVTRFNDNKEARNRHYHQNLRNAPRQALIIKLADRLHNLITLWETTESKKRRKVIETQDFYLPLAEEHCLLIHEIEEAIQELENSLDVNGK